MVCFFGRKRGCFLGRKRGCFRREWSALRGGSGLLRGKKVGCFVRRKWAVLWGGSGLL